MSTYPSRIQRFLNYGELAWQIGKYALIGAGSVVTRSMVSKAIVHGAPAEVKGFQKDKEIKKYVNSIKNWE